MEKKRLTSSLRNLPVIHKPHKITKTDIETDKELTSQNMILMYYYFFIHLCPFINLNLIFFDFFLYIYELCLSRYYS